MHLGGSGDIPGRQERSTEVAVMKRLEGKVAVITGGNSGIGLATAKRFVEEGAHVVITGRREKELQEAAASIRDNVTTVTGDVTRLEDLDRLYAVVKEKHGHIDVLFANAGWGELAPLAAATEAHFDKTFDLNAKGTFFTVQKALPLFRDGGSIILTSSVANVRGDAAFTRLRRRQGSRALLRSRLDDGAEGSKDPREFHEPRPHRNSGSGEGGPHRRAGGTGGRPVSPRRFRSAAGVSLRKSRPPSCSSPPTKAPSSPAWISPSMAAWPRSDLTSYWIGVEPP